MYGLAVASGTARLLTDAPTTLFGGTEAIQVGDSVIGARRHPRPTTTWQQHQTLRRTVARNAEGFILASATIAAQPQVGSSCGYCQARGHDSQTSISCRTYPVSTSPYDVGQQASGVGNGGRLPLFQCDAVTQPAETQEYLLRASTLTFTESLSGQLGRLEAPQQILLRLSGLRHGVALEQRQTAAVSNARRLLAHIVW